MDWCITHHSGAGPGANQSRGSTKVLLADGDFIQTLFRQWAYAMASQPLADALSSSGSASSEATNTMSKLMAILLITAGSGACIPIGGLIATFERIRPARLEKEFRHLVIAFGGSILLGAVTVVLVPEGISSMGNSLFFIPIFLLGAIYSLPEAIALGGLLAVGAPITPTLALLIVLQKLPEGFNAYRELVAG